MARSAIHIVQHRRRRDQQTDYRLRLSLLRSQMPRLVVRKSNRYVQGQIVEYKPEGDRVIATANSSELRELGWKQSYSNVCAAYLTGLLLGKRAKEAGLTEAILDLGLQRSTAGNVLYGYLKGVLEAGIKVPHDAKMLPSEERASGKHIKLDADVATMKKKVLG